MNFEQGYRPKPIESSVKDREDFNRMENMVQTDPYTAMNNSIEKDPATLEASATNYFKSGNTGKRIQSAYTGTSGLSLVCSFAADGANRTVHPVLEKLISANKYNPKDFTISTNEARYFVMKVYSGDDIHRSIKYSIWCSTEHGNKILDAAFKEREGKGPVFLLFSVTGSGHFCGVAQMMSMVDYSQSAGVWTQDKWNGQIEVKWIYVKDVPNSELKHICLENNENKPVTRSRDTQEVPPEKGKLVLEIVHIYKNSTSIFDDFEYYEKRQAEDLGPPPRPKLGFRPNTVESSVNMQNIYNPSFKFPHNNETGDGALSNGGDSSICSAVGGYDYNGMFGGFVMPPFWVGEYQQSLWGQNATAQGQGHQDARDYTTEDYYRMDNPVPTDHYTAMDDDIENESAALEGSASNYSKSGNTGNRVQSSYTINAGLSSVAARAAVAANRTVHPVLEKLKSANRYNPKDFTISTKEARYFVMKTYSGDDIHRSIKYSIWCSTEHGNKILDAAFKEREGKGPVYLIYSVNGSGHFCGVAQMMSMVDYSQSAGVWAQDKWKGQIEVKWIYVKDVPNSELRHICLENNENKPVTRSRDTQEIPTEKGKLVLEIVHNYKNSTSIFDDFEYYEKRQEDDLGPPPRPKSGFRPNTVESSVNMQNIYNPSFKFPHNNETGDGALSNGGDSSICSAVGGYDYNGMFGGFVIPPFLVGEYQQSLWGQNATAQGQGHQDARDYTTEDYYRMDNPVPTDHYTAMDDDIENESAALEGSASNYSKSGNTGNRVQSSYTINAGLSSVAARAAVAANRTVHPVLEKLKSANRYNPKDFTISTKEARYFVMKTYSGDDIHRSIKYSIWCSTEHGNKILDAAFKEREGKGPVYLIYSVNGSGHFCGVAQMMSMVDYSQSAGVWAQDKWKGQIEVKWIYVKDVPNSELRHICLENNENKLVTRSRDTQEIPTEKGKLVLEIVHNYKNSTSIFDDFEYYEKRQEDDLGPPPRPKSGYRPKMVESSVKIQNIYNPSFKFPHNNEKGDGALSNGVDTLMCSAVRGYDYNGMFGGFVFPPFWIGENQQTFRGQNETAQGQGRKDASDYTTEDYYRMKNPVPTDHYTAIDDDIERDSTTLEGSASNYIKSVNSGNRVQSSYSINAGLSSVAARAAVAANRTVHPVLEKLKSANQYNPKDFTISTNEARYFVMKRYSDDDIHRSIKYSIWCSTEHGNKILDAAFKEREGKGPVYLLFSVTGSGHFCGVAQMMSMVDYSQSAGVWVQDKWKGQIEVKWIYIKDVPNSELRHILLENNENKPVTRSRDTQEVPPEKGKQVLKIVHNYKHSTSIFDEFEYYEKRQADDQGPPTRPKSGFKPKTVKSSVKIQNIYNPSFSFPYNTGNGEGARSNGGDTSMFSAVGGYDFNGMFNGFGYPPMIEYQRPSEFGGQNATAKGQGRKDARDYTTEDNYRMNNPVPTDPYTVSNDDMDRDHAISGMDQGLKGMNIGIDNQVERSATNKLQHASMEQSIQSGSVSHTGSSQAPEETISWAAIVNQNSQPQKPRPISGAHVNPAKQNFDIGTWGRNKIYACSGDDRKLQLKKLRTWSAPRSKRSASSYSTWNTGNNTQSLSLSTGNVEQDTPARPKLVEKEAGSAVKVCEDQEDRKSDKLNMIKISTK